jgi:serine/threonine protein kinase
MTSTVVDTQLFKTRPGRSFRRQCGFFVKVGADVAEIQNLIRLPRHPHIATFITFYCDEDNNLNIVYEDFGIDLFFHLEEKGKFSEKFTLHVLTNITSALDAAHAIGLAHLDVSTENIMAEEGVVIDWETAQHYKSKLMHPVGKKTVMAPELVNLPDDYDLRVADMWSLGTVLFAMLTGLFMQQRPNGRNAQVCLKYGPLVLFKVWKLPEPTDQFKDILKGLLCPWQKRWTSRRLKLFLEKKKN